MKRRDALRTFAAAAGAVPTFARLSVADMVTVGREARKSLPADRPRIPETLTRRQNATVTELAELIIPETDTPGARAVRVNEFIDVILTDWYDDGERSTFLAGLDDLDGRCRLQFGRDFLSCTGGERHTVVAQLDADLTATRDESPEAADETFFHQMKRLTLTGYFTSEVGMTEVLGYEIIPGRYDGCVPRA